MTFGSSQQGKSSGINTIARRNIARVGDGDGHSTTKGVNWYTVMLGKKKVLIFDVPGTNDT